MADKIAFQADVSKMLDIVINSLYSEKQIFLRELISNASDACDKLHYLALTHPDIAKASGAFKITITPDEKANTLTIADNGIGMNKEDLINHLGTIAKSGTAEFVKNAGENGSVCELIGQFGVGFYSAFMVADKVEILTRKAGEDKAWKWVSNGIDGFEITKAEKEVNGTEIKLFLKKDEKNKKLVIITTYDSFCGNDDKILESLDLDSTLIIADEVHKFGAASYSKKLPEKIKYRIGLSATPKRPYDEKGTKAIFDYFCPSETPYVFSIKDAIDADMLCHYEYHPTVIPLTDFEMEDYENISEKISRLSVIVNNSAKTDKEDEERLEQLLKERHRIIERAQNKRSEFLEIMQSEISKYKDRTIVFCPDGKDENGKDFLEVYKSELWNEFVSKGKIVRMSEYVQGTKREIIENFTAGAIDILFAKQRLNEGIDIPAAKRAFFIASSTSEREFIQRRGRVLRKSPETNKTLAEIFDFIVVPPDRNSIYAQSIVENEIKRAMDFAATADNYAEIEKILRKYL